MTLEGEEHEKWLEIVEDMERKQRDSISSKTDSGILVLDSRRPSLDSRSDFENDEEDEEMETDMKVESPEKVEKPQPAKRIKIQNSTSPDEMYEVERILGCSRATNGQLWYLVKWLNYSDENNSWEPESGMKTATKAIKEFFKNNQ